MEDIREPLIGARALEMGGECLFHLVPINSTFLGRLAQFHAESLEMIAQSLLGATSHTKKIVE